jgi:hypothetical protein
LPLASSRGTSASPLATRQNSRVSRRLAAALQSSIYVHSRPFSFRPRSTTLFHSRAPTVNEATRAESRGGCLHAQWFRRSESVFFPTPLDNVKVILPLARFDSECRDEGRSREGESSTWFRTSESLLPSPFSFRPPSTTSRLFCPSCASTMNAATRVEVERGSLLST